MGRPKRRRHRHSTHSTSSPSSERGFFRSITRSLSEEDIASGAYRSRLKNLYFALLPEFALVDKGVDVRSGFQVLAATTVEQVQHVYKENAAGNMRRWHLKAVRALAEPGKKEDREPEQTVRHLGMAGRALHRVGAIGRAGRALGEQILQRGTGRSRVLPRRLSPRGPPPSTSNAEGTGARQHTDDCVHAICIPHDLDGSGVENGASALGEHSPQKMQHQQLSVAETQSLEMEELACT